MLPLPPTSEQTSTLFPYPTLVLSERRQQAVDQAGQALGIAPVELGDASEAAHLGDQQRHLPSFAAQYQALRAARQLVNQGRRQVLPEGAAHEAALALLMEVVVEHEKSVDEKDCAKKIGRAASRESVCQ